MTCGPPTEVEEENFDSPILRRLVETWDDYEHDELDEEDVLDVLDRIEDLAMEQVQSMEESAKLPDVDILDPNRIASFKPPNIRRSARTPLSNPGRRNRLC